MVNRSCGPRVRAPRFLHVTCATTTRSVRARSAPSCPPSGWPVRPPRYHPIHSVLRPGITGRSPATDFSDAWRCASFVCPQFTVWQHQTGVHRMNSSHRPRRRRTQPQAPSSLKSYRHIGKSGSARGRSADRLSGKADRPGRHLQGWCAKGVPTTHPVPAQWECQGA